MERKMFNKLIPAALLLISSSAALAASPAPPGELAASCCQLLACCGLPAAADQATRRSEVPGARGRAPFFTLEELREDHDDPGKRDCPYERPHPRNADDIDDRIGEAGPEEELRAERRRRVEVAGRLSNQHSDREYREALQHVEVRTGRLDARPSAPARCPGFRRALELDLRLRAENGDDHLHQRQDGRPDEQLKFEAWAIAICYGCVSSMCNDRGGRNDQ